MPDRVAYITLGCKLNFAETSTLSRQFAQAGYQTVPHTEVADVYVINTCSVTEHADKKCRNIIRRLHKLSPEAVIAVTGCYAQLKPSEILSVDGVEIVAGANFKGDLFDLVQQHRQNRAKASYCCPFREIETVFPAYSSGDRTRSFLKIQDGCDSFCSYCTVPFARGRSRNVPVAEIVRQAEAIASQGTKEIVITGVNTGDFGRTTGEDFFGLLKALNEVDGIERYRISSIEANFLTPEIVRWIASGTKFLPHFHIPVQSGCDKVLKEMHRHYTTSEFADKISLIRDLMESKDERYTRVFFGIDVIVGFPGETDEDFEQTYQFLSQLRPAYLHVFPYSRRSGTLAAARRDQVKDSVKSLREARLLELCARLHKEFCDANRGRQEKVLFESTEKDGMMSGYTGNYIKVVRPYDASLIGRIVDVVV